MENVSNASNPANSAAAATAAVDYSVDLSTCVKEEEAAAATAVPIATSIKGSVGDSPSGDGAVGTSLNDVGGDLSEGAVDNTARGGDLSTCVMKEAVAAAAASYSPAERGSGK